MSLSINTIEHKRVFLQVCRPCHLSDCQSVLWVSCGKMADWIWMLFGMVSGISHRVGVLDWVETAQGAIKN